MWAFSVEEGGGTNNSLWIWTVVPISTTSCLYYRTAPLSWLISRFPLFWETVVDSTDQSTARWNPLWEVASLNSSSLKHRLYSHQSTACVTDPPPSTRQLLADFTSPAGSNLHIIIRSCSVFVCVWTDSLLWFNRYWGIFFCWISVIKKLQSLCFL